MLSLGLGIIKAQSGTCTTKVEVNPIYSQDFGTGNTTTTDPNVVDHTYVGISPNDGSYSVTTSNTQTLQYTKTDLTGNKDAGYNNITDGSTNGRYLMININSGGSNNKVIYRISSLNVIIGQEYRFRLDMAGLCNNCADVPNLQLSIKDNNNNVLASANSGNLGMANDDVWRRLMLSFTATTSTVKLEIVNLQPNGNNGNDVGIDNIVFTPLECDSDGDGIPNSLDLDDDNDGILDSEEGCVGTVTMATVQSSTVTALNNNGTGIFTLVPPGATLPNGGVKITSNSGSGSWQSYTPTSMSTATLTIKGVQSAPFSTTYLDLIGNIPRTLTIDFGTSAYGLGNSNNSYQYIVGIAGLGGPENATSTTTFSVPLTVVGNADVYGSGFYSLLNGAQSNVIGLSGTIFQTNTPLTTVQGYTFFSVPVGVSSFTMTLTGGNDPHGMIFGVYNVDCSADNDGDTIPNYIDTDSDGDGCPDAIEGSENVTYTMVNPLSATTNPGQIKVRYDGITTGTPSQIISTASAANGVPQLVNNAINNTNSSIGLANNTNAGVVDNTDGTADVGQGKGNSQDNSLNDCKCYRNPSSGGVDLPTLHGITSFNRAGSGNSNWPMVRNNGWTALESNTKPFVMNRMPSATANGANIFLGEPLSNGSAAITAPVVGMTYYDTTNDCMKINTNGTRTGWKCFKTQSCPEEN